MAKGSLLEKGLNFISSNKFTTNVLKTTKELMTPNGGVNGLIQGAMENQAKRMIKHSHIKGQPAGVASEMRYMAGELLNGATGSNRAIQRGANFKGGKAREYVRRPNMKNTGKDYMEDVRKFYGVNGANESEYMRNMMGAINSDKSNYRMFGNRFDNVNRKNVLRTPATFKDYSDYNTLYSATITGAQSMEDINFVHRGIGNAMSGQGVAREYLWDGATKGQRAARIGAVAAGYVGVNAVGRALTGGDMRHNRKGEDDIAGIPFL